MAESTSLADTAVLVPPLRDRTAGHRGNGNWLGAAMSRTFAALPHQVAVARQFVAGLLDEWPGKDDALVCLSELATNALLHSRSACPGGTFTVHVHRCAGTWRVGVSDNGGAWRPRAPVCGTYGQDTDGLTSRGLAIVAVLATRVRIERYGESGRLVWFEIPDGTHPAQML